MLEYIDECKNYIGHRKIIKKLICDGIEKDVNEELKKNREYMIEKYLAYFKNKINLKSFTTIVINKSFYRARNGYITIKTSKGNADLIIPRHDNDMLNPPNSLAVAGRFNRKGVSYLYLCSDVPTCMSEIHVAVGDSCTVAEFISIDNFKVLNLYKKPNDIEMQIWYEIMTQPVYKGIEHKYLITQFLSDVFKRINENGIFFRSTQSGGENLVCFRPAKLFKIVPFSERIYKTTIIQIHDELCKDSTDIKDDILNNLINEEELFNEQKEDIQYIIDSKRYRE